MQLVVPAEIRSPLPRDHHHADGVRNVCCGAYRIGTTVAHSLRGVLSSASWPSRPVHQSLRFAIPRAAQLNPFVADVLPRGSDVFGPGPRVAAVVASSTGALVVIIGSTWSMIRLLRIGTGTARRGALGNGLIVAGALVLSWGGLLNSILDEMTGFAVSLLVGISLIFAGAMVATGSRSTG